MISIFLLSERMPKGVRVANLRSLSKVSDDSERRTGRVLEAVVIELLTDYRLYRKDRGIHSKYSDQIIKS